MMNIAIPMLLLLLAPFYTRTRHLTHCNDCFLCIFSYYVRWVFTDLVTIIRSLLVCFNTHTDTHTHTHTHAHTHTHTHTHACIHTHTHACTHTRMHAHTHACMHTHTRMHAHTHTNALQINVYTSLIASTYQTHCWL